jgi:Lon protease-like protein
VAVLPRVIPLFPLPNVVLFPGMPLPLNIFEPRYRRMTADSLNGERVIGMVLLKPGWEADYNGRPAVYPVGCAGHLEKCDPLPDGRFDVLLKGTARFRIHEEHGGQPYRLASVEAHPEDARETAGLDDLRGRVLAAIGRAADGPAILVTREKLPHELFVNALCQSLRLAPVEQQSLLDCDTLLARYARLLEILDFRALERTYGQRGRDSVH